MNGIGSEAFDRTSRYPPTTAKTVPKNISSNVIGRSKFVSEPRNNSSRIVEVACKIDEAAVVDCQCCQASAAPKIGISEKSSISG